ncbi:4231_t:CDS:2, partial [Funneliformis geosporum]
NGLTSTSRERFGGMNGVVLSDRKKLIAAVVYLDLSIQHNETLVKKKDIKIRARESHQGEQRSFQQQRHEEKYHLLRKQENEQKHLQLQFNYNIIARASATTTVIIATTTKKYITRSTRITVTASSTTIATTSPTTIINSSF